MRAVLTLTASLLAGAMLGGWLWAYGQPDVYTSHFENVMGTSLDIRLRTRSDAASQRAEAAILGEIARESKILSGYDPDSEFSRWMRSREVPTHVSPELIDVLSAFDDWRARTSGALDPAAEAVSRLWQRAAIANRLPTQDELQLAVLQVRQTHWIVDRASSTATHTSDVPIVLNSFTKSYIVDRAARVALDVPGVNGVLLNAGGDVVVRGAWTQTVGVADALAKADNASPLAELNVRDAVVATSGGYKRGFDIGGRHYSHLIDPRTGQPSAHVLSATVVSSNAIVAGALATALCLLTPSESLALAGTTPGVEFFLTLEGGRRVESTGWSRFEARPPTRPAVRGPEETLYAADQSPWNVGWQLSINLELARPAGMARRPYVAVWIEDKDQFPVRTLALWYDGKGRYLPELRAWYRADRLRAMAEGAPVVNAVTSPTRSAGTYTLQWDGKDNAGKLVAAGTYTVCIEAAREHGTYQIIRQAMDFSGTPKQLALPGGTEISAASLDYH